MSKFVIAKSSDLRIALKQGRDAVNGTTSIIRAHARQISYDDKIERMQKNVGSKVNSIITAFKRLSTAVARRVGNTQLLATSIVTPEVINDILTPYRVFLESMNGAKSIDEALAYMEVKRTKELATYGKTPMLVEKINKYFDLQRDKYLLPLRTIEVQINEMNKHLKYTAPVLNTVSKVVIKLDAPKTEKKPRKPRAKKVKPAVEVAQQTIGA